MADELPLLFPCGRREDPHHPIPTARDNTAAVGRKAAALHPIRVAREGQQEPAGSDLPNPRHPVSACGEQPIPCGGDGNLSHRSLMPHETPHHSPLQIDQRHQATAGHGHLVSGEKLQRFDIGIRRHLLCCDRSRKWAHLLNQSFFRSEVDDCQTLVGAATGQQGAGGAPCHSKKRACSLIDVTVQAPIRGAPDAQSAILAGRSHPLAIGRYAHIVHFVMRGNHPRWPDGRPGRVQPHDGHPAVSPAGGHRLAIRRPGKTVDVWAWARGIIRCDQHVLFAMQPRHEPAGCQAGRQIGIHLPRGHQVPDGLLGVAGSPGFESPPQLGSSLQPADRRLALHESLHLLPAFPNGPEGK